MDLILIVSILLRLAAMGWSIVLLVQIRDLRMGFLSIMLGLMALRQMLTLWQSHESWSLVITWQTAEFPGLIVSIMAFLSIFFLKRILTDRKLANDRITNLNEQLFNNQQVLLKLEKETFLDLETALKHIVEVDAEHLNISRVSVWLYNHDHTEIVCKCQYQAGEIIDQGEIILRASQYPHYFEALEKSRTISATDAHSDPRTAEFSKDYLLPLKISSMMDVPIRLQGKTVGIVCHEHIGPKRVWSAQEEDFAASIADICALSLQVAESKQIEKTLQESNERFSVSFTDANIGMALVSLDHSIIEANSAFCNMLGYSIDQITGILLNDITHPDDVNISHDYHHKLIVGEIDNYNFEKRYLHKQGHDVWVLLNVSLVRDEKATPLYTVAQIQNISERKQAEEALKSSEERFRDLYDSNPHMLFTLDESGKVLSVNPFGIEQLGYPKDQLVGKPVINVFYEEDRKLAQEYLQQCFAQPNKVHKWELRKIRQDGSLLWVQETARVLDGENGTTKVLIFCEDITATRRLSEQLGYQASHDALTGLINRREFERRTERLLLTVRQDQTEHALCFMDIDQFKVVNDTCGHTAGDELLRQLSKILQKIVRHSDTLARLGGDEFGVLMEHCTLEHARRVATSLRKAIQDHQFVWEEHSFKVGVSIGLVPITDTTSNLTELLKQADAACYMAKEMGRNRIHVYHKEDQDLAQRHGEMQWVARINQAIEDNRFCLYAQSIVPLDGGTDKHYEFLIRMKDEKGAIIAPGAFLPAAERYDLISKLDRWVIGETFSLLAANPAFLEQINFCSINLSGQSLTDPEILEFIITQLDKLGTQGNKICFEITETAAISNLNMAMKFISTLKGLRCRFALDDFGSGLSSFAYLKNLPVDYLKIDGMFVKNIVNDPIDRAMVKSINEIGQVMGMKTIAEFVENNEIKDKLKAIGVDYAQGYAIGKPQPLDSLLGKQNNVTSIKSA